MTTSNRLLLQSWVLFPILALIPWAVLFYGPLTWTIPLVLAIGILAAACRKQWVAMACLMVSNPLGISFCRGIVDYSRGAPRLLYMGLPRLESFNVDQASRCFYGGGGCIVWGHEWVFMDPHNLAVRLLSRLCGPPSRSYSGPYPAKEDALRLVTDSPALALDEFVQGKVRAENRLFTIETNMLARLLDGLSLHSLRRPDAVFIDRSVRAHLYRGRCLIIRMTIHEKGAQDDFALWNQDAMVFFDVTVMRPFAYFTIRGQSMTRFPPVLYLQEEDEELSREYDRRTMQSSVPVTRGTPPADAGAAPESPVR